MQNPLMIAHIRQRRVALLCRPAATLLLFIGLLIPGCRKSNEITAADLEKAVRHGDATRVERILNDAPDLLTERCDAGTTFLHVAAATGHIPVIELLIAKDAEIEALDARSRTPLLHAATHRRSSAAKCLLGHGADVLYKDLDGRTALHIAAENDRAATVALLIEHGADVNTRLPHGTTPLHSALLLGFEDIAALMLEAGADPAASTDDGHTPLEIARSKARQDLVDLLLKHGAK